MIKLPGEFLSIMQAELGADYDAFLQSYDMPAVKGLRVNTLKASIEEVKKLCPAELEPVPFCDEGFSIKGEWQNPGSTPMHIAGLIYMQEPSAMLTVSIAEIEPGMNVLDMCAAPGGKSSAAAARLMGRGMLVSNEIVPSRANILLSTIERMGAANAVVSCCRPDELAKALPEYFDRVIVDAPCSGEGMFRKDARAIEEWSLEHVASCAKRQRLILESSAECVAYGGMLIYSTCTFSKEENEDNIEAFLAAHSDFELVKAIRLYPHKFNGEGHFAASLRRKANTGANGAKKQAAARLEPCRIAAYQDFINDTFSLPPNGTAYLLKDQRVHLMPFELPESMTKLRLLSAGVSAGELQKGRFVPAHMLVMAEHGGEYKRTVELNEDEAMLKAYMRGEESACDEAYKGYCRVSYNGHSIGWGKAVSGRLKNHLPKGLRIDIK